MAAVSSNLIRIDPTGGRVMIQTNSDDESVDDNPNNALFADEKQCNTSEETVDDCDNVLQDNNGKDLFKSHLHSSPFAMQNVLRMKKERNSTSPENNVFSTEKLLQNTPCCEETTLRNSPFSERRESISYDGYSPKYNDSLNCQSSSISGDDGECQNYANCSGNFDLDDDRTCCSDDTVLSVGNEAPGANFNDEDNRTASRPSPVHSPAGNLTSFKHIQSHLNAISQLSQNFNQSQHVLLRPNPVAANPLIFLNQSHLLFPQAIDPILGNSLTAAGAIQQMQPNLLQHHSSRLGFGGNFGGINPGAAPMRQFKNQQGSSQMSLVNGQSRTHKEIDQRKTIHAQNETANEETLHQGRLKFSIDNILKADFGRRITDPLTKRKSNHGKVRSANSQNGITKQSTAYAVQESAYASSKIKDAAFPSAGNSSLIAPSPEKSPSETSRTLDSKFQASAVSKSSAAKPDKSGVMDLSKPDGSESGSSNGGDGAIVWPAWVYCTRYSDRPSSGRSPRTRRPKKPPGERSPADEKRPRTAFSGPQLARLKHEFNENRYLTERRRQQLASELGLAEAQIKIWFQNKRAKIKKASGQKNPLALQLMAQGLYNHSTVPLTREEEELEMQAREARERNA